MFLSGCFFSSSAFSSSIPDFSVRSTIFVFRSILLTVFPFACYSCFLLAFHFSCVSSLFCSCSFLSFFWIKNSLQGLWLFAHELILPSIYTATSPPPSPLPPPKHLQILSCALKVLRRLSPSSVIYPCSQLTYEAN